jgi:hypothetical protein
MRRTNKDNNISSNPKKDRHSPLPSVTSYRGFPGVPSNR